MTIPPPYYFSEVEENPRFQRLIITPTGFFKYFYAHFQGKEIDTETIEISQLLLQAMKLRTEYVYKETKIWKSNEKPSPTATFSPFDAEIPVSQVCSKYQILFNNKAIISRKRWCLLLL